MVLINASTTPVKSNLPSPNSAVSGITYFGKGEYDLGFTISYKFEMKLKWYLENTVKNILILFFISMIFNIVSIALGDEMTFEYMILWSLSFSLLVTIGENIIYRLIPKKMSQCETDRLILKLIRSDYVETPEYNYTNPSKVRYFKHNSFFTCYKDVIIYLNGEENTVYLSRIVLRKYEQ